MWSDPLSTVTSTYLPRGSHQPRGSRPWCAACDTDRHLLVDSVAVMNRRLETLAVAFNCAKCGGSRVLATTVAFVAAILSLSAERDDAGHLASAPN